MEFLFLIFALISSIENLVLAVLNGVTSISDSYYVYALMYLTIRTFRLELKISEIERTDKNVLLTSHRKQWSESADH